MKKNVLLLLSLGLCLGSIQAQTPQTIFKALLPAPQKITIMDLPGINPHLVYPNPAKEVVHTTLSKRIKHREGYHLSIRQGQVSIQAQTKAGVLYAQQTLKQLAQDATEQGIDIPACEIKDYPSTDYRAIHIDLKHHLDKKEYLYQVLQRMAYYKLNAAIVGLKIKLRIKRIRKLEPKMRYLSKSGKTGPIMHTA